MANIFKSLTHVFEQRNFGFIQEVYFGIEFYSSNLSDLFSTIIAILRNSFFLIR